MYSEIERIERITYPFLVEYSGNGELSLSILRLEFRVVDIKRLPTLLGANSIDPVNPKSVSILFRKVKHGMKIVLSSKSSIQIYKYGTSETSTRY